MSIDTEQWDDDDKPDVEPTPEPDEERADPHRGPLDNPDDSKFLDPDDPRRGREGID